MRNRNIEKLIKEKNIDFIDFGSSKGGSIDFSMQQLGGRNGLGIDICPKKVETANSLGFNSIEYNIHNLPKKKLVDFVIMSHFLEHVPDRNDVKAFIKKSCDLSKKFVYIQQPFFDADGWLFNKGYKLFWSDWKGHPNRMTSLELYIILRDLKDNGFPINFSIHGYKKINSSSSDCIQPYNSKIDQLEYNSKIDPKKKLGDKFDINIFKEIKCLITFSENNHVDVLKKLKYDYTIYSSLSLPAVSSEKYNTFSFKRIIKSICQK